MRECIVARVPMRHPGDVSEIERLIADGTVAAGEIVAVLGKTEGNGCVNDFTRAYASDMLKLHLGARLGMTPDQVGEKVATIMSGGTEGALSPHFVVIAVRESDPETGDPSTPDSPRLAVGASFTPDLLPEDIGRMAQVRATADAVTRAIRKAGIERPEDVHWVQIKCPLLTTERVNEARARGHETATDETYRSMALSRGASALGVALALGEIAPEMLSDAVIGRDMGLWSERASTSAGIELMRNEVIVLGNGRGWAGNAVIAHDVMRDPIDVAAVRTVLRRLGMEPGDQLTDADSRRVIAVLVKAEPSRDGLIRGHRHIMWDDSDINATRHGRALVGGVVAAAIGHAAIFVSGGAEHQGPDGGGPIAVIARVDS